MTDELKTWAAVDNGLIVHAGFSAPQSYIDSYDEQVVERADRTTPPWYHEGVTFLDITNMNPRPLEGWFKDAANVWQDGNSAVVSDKTSIAADGIATATVIFSQKGPKAPKTVTFIVNGQEVVETVTNGQAKLEVTSTNPGDIIVVEVGGRTVTINVEI